MEIPLQPVPAQSLTCNTDGGQALQISLYQKGAHLYADVTCDGVAVATGAICLNGVRIVKATYLGMVGNLAFIDSHGDADPVYTGLGSRFGLIYDVQL